jgi:uncharacterized protein (DUF1015 family)
MPTIAPIPHALVPADTAAAQALTAPNYDEFQSDREVWELLQSRPGNILKVTMPHCDVPTPEQMLEDGSEAALDKARANLQDLAASSRVRGVSQILWVYEIISPKRPGVRLIGLGGFARTGEIRTDRTPEGCIVRNEGIRQKKADGRAQLIQKTQCFTEGVNCAVEDRGGELITALERIADSRPCDYSCVDEAGNRHSSWLVSESPMQRELSALLAAEPAAYVADGNHRSAAAATLGREHFLCVFFPTSRMGLEPYNRLVEDTGIAPPALLGRLGAAFAVRRLESKSPYRPEQVHHIGLYIAGHWYRLEPKPGTFDAANAAECIDADILQRHLFAGILGITDARDERLNFVGGNKDAAYLQSRVDSGEYQFAISLAPVTMQQFIDVCAQNRFMPPKSTWFDPKVRSGLVIALF